MLMLDARAGDCVQSLCMKAKSYPPSLTLCTKWTKNEMVERTVFHDIQNTDGNVGPARHTIIDQGMFYVLDPADFLFLLLHMSRMSKQVFAYFAFIYSIFPINRSLPHVFVYILCI